MYFLLDACKHPTILSVLYFGYLFWEILAVLIPIGLIIMLMIDFTKAVVINKEDEQVKSMKLVGKRIMYAVFIFATPWLVSLVMSVLGSAGLKLGGDYTECINTVKNIANGTDNMEKYDNLLKAEEELEKEQQRQKQEENKKSNGNEASGRTYAIAASELIKLAKGEMGHKGGGKYSGGPDSTPWCAYFVFWNISQVSVDNVGTIKQIIEKDGKFNADYTGIAGGTMVTFNESSNLNFYYSKYYGGNYTPKKGDFIYFRNSADWNKKIYGSMFEETSHIGLVDYYKDGKVYTVEGYISGGYGSGSANNVVGTKEYDLSSSRIMGYGSWYDASGNEDVHQSSSGEYHGGGGGSF